MWWNVTAKYILYCEEWVVRNVSNTRRRGDGEVRTVTIWKRPTEVIEDLATREEFFNEYWWAE